LNNPLLLRPSKIDSRSAAEVLVPAVCPYPTSSGRIRAGGDKEQKGRKADAARREELTCMVRELNCVDDVDVPAQKLERERRSLVA
jgi:hypothetical protein